MQVAQKSSFSGAGNDCVYVVRVGDNMLRVYESERPEERGMVIACSQFGAFIAGLLTDQFVELREDGLVRISTSLATGEVITSPQNFDKFFMGVRNHEFDPFCKLLKAPVAV